MPPLLFEELLGIMKYWLGTGFGGDQCTMAKAIVLSVQRIRTAGRNNCV